MTCAKRIIECSTNPITYTLVIKKVKNINMRISQNGDVVVSANPFVPLEKVDDFVSSKASWILRHQKQMEMRQSYTLCDETHIMLFGNQLRIKKTIAKYNHVCYDKHAVYIKYKENTTANQVLQTFITKLCHDVFMDILVLTQQALQDYHLPMPNLKIRDMKSRWGSCTPAKNLITLNKKCIHYPFEFIEYVILHEFVHFIQPNHSKAFYRVIENYMPDYKQRMNIVSQFPSP